MQILLSKNRGYTWISDDNGNSFKGYFQYLTDEKPYRGECALHELSNVQTLAEMTDFLSKIDGVFAIVLNREDHTIFAVDRARSIPIYYSKGGTILSDSSEAVRKALHIAREDIDATAGVELYTTRYVSGEATIYSEIKQLNGGMCACIAADGTVKKETYYRHYAARGTENIDEIKQKLTESAERMMRRVLAAVGDRPIVLSMSGGYDSRFVGCMLKRLGAKDVSCYTYGKSDSFEIQQSKKNAEALGFRWRCVEHTDQSVLDMIGEGGKEYFDYCTEHDYPIYLQNYIAIKELHESGWIKTDSVFLTGLCGDMPTGEYILPPEKMKWEYNAEGCADFLMCEAEEISHIQPQCRDVLYQKVLARVQKVPFTINDYQTFWSTIDCITTLDVHSRVFLNMNRVHEFFGYEWLLPYWDENLLKVWYSVPAELRAEQAMYEDWLLNDICAPYGLGTKKSIASVAKSPMAAKMKRTLGAAAQWVMLRLNIPIRRKFDINNNAVMEPTLFQRLHYRGRINYRHASATMLLTRYVMEQRYGTDAVIEVCSHLAI